MPKIPKKYLGPLVIAPVLLAGLIAATSSLAYKLGERHIAALILHSGVPDGKQAPLQPTNYAETIEQLRAERSRLSSDYDSACSNYQALYEAYDALYAQSGRSSGYAKITRPDSARGNQESCYR